jgi:DNA polymerase III epsilon subunit-like protein
VVINPRNLELYKTTKGDVVYFESLMRPLDFDKLEDDALRVNKKTREELTIAPLPGQVWENFARFVRKWNIGGKNTGYCSPVAAGHNILGFDNVITQRLCEQYKILRKDGKQGIFHDRWYFDTMQMAKDWFWWSKEPTSFSLDNLRDFFGISKEGAHDALKDVMDTSAILIKFLGLMEELGQRVKFKDCFGENPRRIGT